LLSRWVLRVHANFHSPGWSSENNIYMNVFI
jgi:hypothetical protein